MRSAVIVAAGISERYGEKDKLSEKLFGKTVLELSVDVFKNSVDEIIVVGDCEAEGVKTVKGGKTRFESVQNGLSAVSDNCDTVAVHDGARPFVSRELVKKLFEEAEKYGSAVPKTAVTDTLWSNNGLRTVDRAEFFTVQTPQVFNFEKLKKAFCSAEKEYGDESSLFFDAYGEVRFVQGETSNKKITYFGDLPEFRIGAGFDVHPLVEGDGVILGGVKIPFVKKLLGHSDADVLCHAVCDAVLSASDNRDIGFQFPDSDDKYKNADSVELLKRCVELAKSNGFETVNVSAVVICQQPKIAPYIEEISKRLADALRVDKSCVNVSATTTEKLGALGNGDGIAAEAQALLKRTR